MVPPISGLDRDLCASLGERLEALPVVERAFVEEESGEAWLVVQPDAQLEPILAAAAEVLEPRGLDAAGLRVELLTRTTAIRERVRFDGVVVESMPGGVRARVELEWGGVAYRGEAVEGLGPALEHRAIADAAIRALDAVTGSSLRVRIVGIKQIRAFDVDLVIVALYRSGEPPNRLVGSVRVDADPRRAVALAVLNALNRILGKSLLSRE